MTHGGARQSGSFLLFRHHNQNSPDPPEAIPPARISVSAAVAATVHPVVTAQPPACASRRAKFQQSLRNAGHMRICE